MKSKFNFLAILLAILPTIAFGGNISPQHKLTVDILNAETDSYIVITDGDNVTIATFDYKNPTETCKFLKNKGVNIVRVVNHDKSKDEGGTGRSTEVVC